MGKGILRLQVVAAYGAVLIPDAAVTLLNEDGQSIQKLVTDDTGHTPDIGLAAPDEILTQEPSATQRRYALYHVKVNAAGYQDAIVNGIMIFDNSTSEQVINMQPAVEGALPNVTNIGGHALDKPVMPKRQLENGRQGRLLQEVVIPDFITVHLGRPEANAANVRVPYIDYIKNVASHEIFDSWPTQAIIANVYCIVSLTLNRIYTEFYRIRGYNFDITSDTSTDQMYVHGGTIGANISRIVDDIFNNYLAVVGHKEPFLSLYNDGVAANYPGRLSQWGSFYDAKDRGMNAWQIISKYFTPPLVLRESILFVGPLESWPGYTLTMGSQGENVRTMQRFLNRVLGRYTNVIINPVDGVFGQATRNSVLLFQQIYGLPQTGEINRATWYEISRLYSIEKALWEMHSEGQNIGIGTTPPTTTIREGVTGALVSQLQYLLDYIGMYNDKIPFVADTSRFDSLTVAAVKAFQRAYGLTDDGVVGATTWKKLYEVYRSIEQNVETQPPTPPPPAPPKMPPYPGSPLKVGSSGSSVLLLQQAINRLADVVPGLWKVSEDGSFGTQTSNVIKAYQRSVGLVDDGADVIIGLYPMSQHKWALSV